MEKLERQRAYAFKVISANRDYLMMRHPYLARALYELRLVSLESMPEKEEGMTGATDGINYYIIPSELLADYVDGKKKTEIAFLHSVMHCLYLHPFFADKRKERYLWDLACDICVWDILSALEAENEAVYAKEPDLMADPSSLEIKSAVVTELKKELKVLNAQNIYRFFVRNGKTSMIQGMELERLRAIFAVDSHFPWYCSESPKGKDTIGSDQKMDNKKNEQDDMPAKSQDHKQDNDFSENLDEGSGESAGNSEKENRGRGGGSILQSWEDIADQVEVSLEMEVSSREKNRGDRAGYLLERIQGIEREYEDYREFLSKFAVLEERMKIDADSFDYNYYIYGLELFGDMPLIEPLEYKEMHTIHDFVIAIDTSGSCDNTLIKKFLTKTYDILSEKHVFQEEILVHLIQCDAKIQEDVCLHNAEELQHYIEHFVAKGRGGTDFRPVFSTVEKLRAKGELTHIRGLLYFTDGYGTFPSQPTNYKTAFVFLEPDSPVQVPPWAMKIVIEEESL